MYDFTVNVIEEGKICPACKGQQFESAGEGIIGTWPCSFCNGNGRIADIEIMPLNQEEE